MMRPCRCICKLSSAMRWQHTGAKSKARHCIVKSSHHLILKILFLKIFEAGGQPVKNREMRSLAQRGNQAKFSHRMPGIQRSTVAYNLQHLREYNSWRIWASQSRRPPYVADVEARTDRRRPGIDTRKLHGRSRQQGDRRRRLQDSLRGDHFRQGPPIPGGPIEARE